MSFGLSVGDIATTLSLTQDLLQLHELDVVGEDNPIDILRRFQSILAELRNVRPRNNSSWIQYQALLEVASQCQIGLEQFRNLARFQSNDNGGIRSMSNRALEGTSPIWSQKTLTTFRAEMSGHLLSLILLNNFNR